MSGRDDVQGHVLNFAFAMTFLSRKHSVCQKELKKNYLSSMTIFYSYINVLKNDEKFVVCDLQSLKSSTSKNNFEIDRDRDLQSAAKLFKHLR